MCVDGRRESWRDAFAMKEREGSTFEADGQTMKKADALRERAGAAGSAEANAGSGLVGFGATAGHPLAQQSGTAKNFLANGRWSSCPAREASTERFSGRRPRLAARLVERGPHARHAATVGVRRWGRSKGPKKERQHACTALIRRGRPCAVSTVALCCIAPSRLVGAPASPMTMRGVCDGSPYLLLLTSWPRRSLMLLLGEARRRTTPHATDRR